MKKIKYKLISILLSFIMIFSIIPQFSFAESDNITLGDKIETLCNTYSSTSDNGIGIYSDEYSLYRRRSKTVYEGDYVSFHGDMTIKDTIEKASYTIKIYDENNNLLKEYNEKNKTLENTYNAYSITVPNMPLTDKVKVDIQVDDKDGNNIAQLSKTYDVKINKKGTTYLKYLTTLKLKNVDAAVENAGPSIFDAVAFKDEKSGKVNMYLAGTCGVMKNSGGDTDLELMNGFKYEYNYNRGSTARAISICGTSEDDMAVLYRKSMSDYPCIYTYNKEKDTWEKLSGSDVTLNHSYDFYPQGLIMSKDDAYLKSDTNNGTSHIYWDGTKWIKDDLLLTSIVKQNNTTAFAGGVDGNIYKHVYSKNGISKDGYWQKLNIPKLEDDFAYATVLSASQDGKIYVTKEGSVVEGRYVNYEGTQNIYEIDTSKETPTVKTIYDVEKDSDKTFSIDNGNIGLGTDFKGNIYIMSPGNRYTDDNYSYDGSYLFKYIDGSFIRQNVPSMGGVSSSGAVLHPDGVKCTLNPIDKLTLFVGEHGAIYTLDETNTSSETTLEKAKEDAKSSLASEFAKYKESDYSEENWKSLNKIKTDAEKEIEDATAVSDINVILDQAIKDMADVKKASDTGMINVYVTMEKFTLGQGFIIEPVRLTVPKNTQASVVITDLLGEGNYKITGSITSNFYLASVRDDDTEIDIPEYILKAMNNNVDKRQNDEWLGEFDYYNMSGWMYCVNKSFPGVGAAAYKLQDNDVMRWQFTLYGYGADLGGAGSWGTDNLITPADKDDLVRAIADLNASSDIDKILSIKKNRKAFDNGYDVMKNLEATQEEVDEATKALKEIEIPSTDNIKVTFDADNGNDQIVKEVKNGGKLDYTPENPTKKGYTFVGWYEDVDDITTAYENNKTYSKDVTYKAKYAHVSMLGAQAKTVINDKSGIRFGTKIYNDGDEVIEKGTLIIPVNLLKENETLTLDTNNVAKSVGKVNYEVNKEENSITYLGTVVNIPKDKFDTQITASAYVKYKDKSGNEYTVYAPYLNTSISVNQLISENK